MTKAVDWLQTLLAAGAMESVRIKEMATSAGIGPKALRSARLKLGVTVVRRGNRSDMRSAWSLPSDGRGVERPVDPTQVLAAHDKPLGSVHVDGLSGDALKAYARRAGVPQRDVDHLTEDRLRQNTKLTIANHFELLSEG